MKKLYVITLALVTLGATAASAAPQPGTPYFFDPISGGFGPARHISATAPLTRNGKIVIVVTMSIESAIVADAPITCSATASLYDASYSNTASTSAGVIRTGATGKCTLSIPYNWTLTATTDTVNISFSVSSGSGYTVDSTSHGSSHSFAAFTVPASGATTSLTLTDSL